MKPTPATRVIAGRRVEYQLKISRSARRLRVRVGMAGVEVVLPSGRADHDVGTFLDDDAEWIHQQLDRAARLKSVTVRRAARAGQILLKGEPTEILFPETPLRTWSNLVRLDEG